MSGDKDAPLSDAEITGRMNAAVRRALNTAPTPTKEIVGKSERAIAQREICKAKARRAIREDDAKF